jgi:hypothetical protein
MTAKALLHFGPGRLTRVIIWVGLLVIGALAGYAIRELPARFRSTSDATPKAEFGPQ